MSPTAYGLLKGQVMDTAPISMQYTIMPLGKTAICPLDELRKGSESLPKTLKAAE